MTSHDIAAKFSVVIPPALPLLTGALGGWLLLGLKILAAMGFMALANAVILYAS